MPDRRTPLRTNEMETSVEFYVDACSHFRKMETGFHFYVETGSQMIYELEAGM